MTVATDIAKSGPFAGAGTTGPFTVGFRFLENSHLKVIKTVGGIPSVLSSVEYTVAGAGSNGGTVTLVSPLPVGQSLTITRNVPITQLADYTTSDSFPAQSHEDALDKLTMVDQQLNAGVQASLRVPDGETAPTIPAATDRASRVLAFDSSGDPIAIVGVDSGSAAALQLDLADGDSSGKGDALVMVKRSWTGAQARTLHAVNNDTCTINDALPAGFNTSNDATAYVQAALSSGVKVVDFLGIALKCDAVTVPAGVWAKNVNLTKYTNAAGNVVLVNTGSMVTGKIAGTGLTSAVQRCVYPAADGVTDVALNVEVSNATFGVHAQYISTSSESGWPKRWTGYVYAHDIVGTVGASEGYGVLLSPALACVLTVNAKDIARHAVYLSAGSRDCDITATVDECANYAVQLYSISSQPSTKNNTIRVKARNLSESVSGQGGAVAIVQKCDGNTVIVDHEGNNATSYSVLVEGSSGGPYPNGNKITGGHITGQFTGTDVVKLLNADSTQITGNTIQAYGTFGVIGIRRTGTNGIVHGGFIHGNNINAQGQTVRGVYCEVNTVPTYIGPNEIRNNGTGLRVDDQTSGYRQGFSRRVVISGTTGSVSATSILDVTATLADSLQTTGRYMDIRLAGSSVDFTKPSIVVGVLAPPSETQYQFRVYNAHSSGQTFTYQGIAEGD